jgi:glucokinase
MDYYVGVDVGGSKILATLAACEGDKVELVEREKLATDADNGSAALERIGLSIDRVIERRGLARGVLAGIGIALPGPVNSGTGIVVECPNIPCLDGVDIRRSFGERYGAPVGVDNDAHAAALAEARSGAGRSLSDFIYVSLGTGIGCGIVIGGKLYGGADGAAGELSHMVFPDLGELYLLASGKALRKRFHSGAEELGARCSEGDPRAEEALRLFVRYVGIGIANMVTLFNPEAVVVGGGLCKLGDRLLLPLEAEIRKYAFSVSARTFSLARAAHGEDAGALGAVYLGQEYARR